MLDYQSLGLVAVVLAVVSGGSLLPVVVVTGVIGVVSLAGEAGVRWYRRHHPRSASRPAPGRGPAATPEADLNRWMAAVERVLGSHD
jgi:uncharacterized membrane protein YebE (DUF533 family)